MGCKEQDSSCRAISVLASSGCNPSTAKPGAGFAPAAAPPKHPGSEQSYDKLLLLRSLTFSLINQLCY